MPGSVFLDVAVMIVVFVIGMPLAVCIAAGVSTKAGLLVGAGTIVAVILVPFVMRFLVWAYFELDQWFARRFRW